MRAQAFTWTVLPAGADAPAAADGTLLLSVHIAPRLVTDEGLPVPTLTQFPDLLDWPATVAGIGWTVNLAGRRVRASRASGPRPDLWRALFPPSTFVRPAAPPDLARRKIRSYPVRNVVDYLIDIYRRTAVSTPTDFPSYGTLIGPDALGPIIADTDLGTGPIEDQIEIILNSDRAVPPGPPDPPADFVQLRRFHRPRGDTLVDLRVPDFDVHDVLALALDHPALLRLLGLVVDLRIAAADLAGLPATTTVSVTPQWTPTILAAGGKSTDTTPATRCLLTRASLAAAPRATAAELTGDGYLPLGDPERYAVVQIDPDGAALKALQLAGNLPRSREHVWDEQPQAYSLPALRSAGFSVARIGRASTMVGTFHRGQQVNDAAGAGQQVVLDAEDVTRGYRIDVWDSTSTQWHSLQARAGRYTFVGTGIELALDDEGTLTAAPTSAADGSSTDLYLPESMFQWTGWSIAAPALGTALDPTDQVSANPDNKAATKYPLEMRFRPQPGTLPRLRFGVAYRFRMRAADLAGHAAAFQRTNGTFDPATATPPVRYARYEPVGSPVIAWHRPSTEGETLDQLVIRSDVGTPVKVDCQRHFLPPQGAQLLAEHHGMFDTPAAPGRPSVVDRTAWAQVAQREGQSLNTSPQGQIDKEDRQQQPFFDVDRLDLPYLPDPVPRGAAFVPLADHAVMKVDFSPAAGRPWYEARPFRLALTGGLQLDAAFDPATRVLTIKLPQAELVTTRLSCYLDPAALAGLGIWQLIEDAKPDPATLSALRALATDGRHWMITPYRTLTFVHAVRRPLAAPEFGVLTATRSPGHTFVAYQDTMSLHHKSTSRLDVLASWQEPVDGGLDAPDPSTRDAGATAYNVPLPTDLTHPVNSLPVAAQHQFGDTKRRVVTYTAVATSRFTRFFVARQRIALPATGPATVDTAGFVPGSVTVNDPDGEYAEDRDYTLDLTAGTITRTPGSHLDAGATVTVEYLSPPVTRTSTTPVVRDVPSSARPAAPEVLYAIPTYGWAGQRTATQITSVRKGGGRRVYLERPWFSSGEGELLGVVLERDPTESKPAGVKDRMRALVTLCGADPLYQTSTAPPPNPTAAAFPLQVTTGTDLGLDGAPEHVDVAGHEVAFDPVRKLWFCDIDVDLGGPYAAMIRLSLVRYQPSSVPGCHLSRSVQLDFTQLGPERTVTVLRNPATPTTAHVTVSGRSYLATSAGAGPSVVLVTPEVTDPGLNGDLAWQPAPPPATAVTLTPAITSGDAVTWAGDVTLPAAPQPGTGRLVIEERETLATSAAGDGAGVTTRTVHTDIVML
jgi:hypothetical protein